LTSGFIGLPFSSIASSRQNTDSTIDTVSHSVDKAIWLPGHILEHFVMMRWEWSPDEDGRNEPTPETKRKEGWVSNAGIDLPVGSKKTVRFESGWIGKNAFIV